jgi:hypothetical protein
VIRGLKGSSDEKRDTFCHDWNLKNVFPEIIESYKKNEGI